MPSNPFCLTDIFFASSFDFFNVSNIRKGVKIREGIKVKFDVSVGQRGDEAENIGLV